MVARRIQRSVAVGVRDRDDEVRLLAKPHEHVADVDAFLHHLVEPEFLGVVARPEIVGPDIGQVASVLADDAQVRQGPDVLVEKVENRLQRPGLEKLVAVVGTGDQLKLGRMLAQEALDELAVIFHLHLEKIEHALAGKRAVVQVDAPTDEQQRNQGAQDGEPHEPPEQARIGPPAFRGDVRDRGGLGSVVGADRFFSHRSRARRISPAPVRPPKGRAGGGWPSALLPPLRGGVGGVAAYALRGCPDGRLCCQRASFTYCRTLQETCHPTGSGRDFRSGLETRGRLHSGRDAPDHRLFIGGSHVACQETCLGIAYFSTSQNPRWISMALFRAPIRPGVSAATRCSVSRLDGDGRQRDWSTLPPHSRMPSAL